MKFKAKLRKKCNVCKKIEGDVKLEHHHLRFKRFNGSSKKRNMEWYCKMCHEKLHSDITTVALTIYFNLEDLSKENPYFMGLTEMLINRKLPKK